MRNTGEKIILISSAFPYRGGIAATTDRLAKELIDRGNNVEIWTFKLLYPSIIFPGKTQYYDKSHKAPENITILRKISSINPFNWIRVGRQLKKSDADKIVFRFWVPFLAPCLGTIAKLSKTKSNKTICIVDNVIPHEKRIGDFTLSKYFFNKIDAFLVMAENGIQELENVFKVKKPISYSPHPLFDIYGEKLNKVEACKQLNISPDKKYILSFGLIRKYKGVDLLIESFNAIKTEFPQHDLIIAGESYDDWTKYQELIDRYHLNDRIIRFAKFIPDNEVKLFFSAADFLALTYRSATQSGVTQIAYSMETPMLVTNVGDLSNMVKDGKSGKVCESNVQSIASALRSMSTEDNLKHYQIGVKEEKKRFGWDRFCDTLDTL